MKPSLALPSEIDTHMRLGLPSVKDAADGRETLPQQLLYTSVYDPLHQHLRLEQLSDELDC
jgi:hypothetical protein